MPCAHRVCLHRPSHTRAAHRCSYARDGQCDDAVHVESINLVCSAGSDCTDCGPLDTFWLPHWAALGLSLLLTALLVLGVRAAVEMCQLWEAQMRGPGSWARIPLTDAHYGSSFINTLANSAQVREHLNPHCTGHRIVVPCAAPSGGTGRPRPALPLLTHHTLTHVQVREKGLKVLQYVLRGVAYSAVLSPALSKELKSLSKATSVARRYFKFGRWVKHFEDLEEAHEQKDIIMRGLRYFRARRGLRIGAGPWRLPLAPHKLSCLP